MIRYAEGAPSSDTLKWNDTDEIFDCGAMQFDITKAKGVIRSKPRPIGFTPVSNHSALLELVVRTRTKQLDVEFPVILATLKNGGHLLIDGWHRVRIAVDRGLEELPAVLLDRDETQTCRYRGRAVREARKRRGY